MQTFTNQSDEKNCLERLEEAETKHLISIDEAHVEQLKLILDQELTRKTTVISKSLRFFYSPTVTLNNKSIKRDDLKIKFYTHLRNHFNKYCNKTLRGLYKQPPVSETTKEIEKRAIQVIEEVTNDFTSQKQHPSEELLEMEKSPIDKTKLSKAIYILCIGSLGSKKIFNAIGNMLQLGENFGGRLQLEASSPHQKNQRSI